MSASLTASHAHSLCCVARPIAQFGRDPERLHTWLVDMGCHKSSMTTHQTAHKIADRVLIKGFKCEIKLSDHVLTSSQSRFGDDQKRAFMNQKLTGNLGDFTGIGSASLANLAAVGITNSDGLFAAFLSIIDNPNPMANTDKCDQFYEQLGRWKVASGFKATIIYQLQSKLAVGIDSSNVGIEYCQQLDAIPEHSLPSTGEQSRALPPRAVHPETGRELFPALDTEQRREAERREAERREAERREVQRREAERREAEQREAERREAERREAERREAERREVQRREAERREAERREAEQREAERREAERREAERREAEQREAERREAERREAERREAEQREAEQREVQRREAERREVQRREAERREAEQLVSALASWLTASAERQSAAVTPEQQPIAIGVPQQPPPIVGVLQQPPPIVGVPQQPPPIVGVLQQPPPPMAMAQPVKRIADRKTPPSASLTPVETHHSLLGLALALMLAGVAFWGANGFACTALKVLDADGFSSAPLPPCTACTALKVLDADGASTVDYAGITFKVKNSSAFIARPKAAIPTLTKLSYAYLTGVEAPAVVCSCL